MAMQYAFKVKISEHIMEDNIGQLICTDVILARDGSYEYTSDEVYEDGKFNIVTLHRDWDDVRKLKYTLEGKPVVYYHPDREIDITVDNISEFTVGHIQNVRESKVEGYNVLIGDLFINDKEVIELVKSGKLREISLGYFYEIDESNKNYLKQIDMIAEHVALVKQGRAGVAKILDSDDSRYILVKLRKDNTPRYLQHVDALTGNDAKWLKLDRYGYYRFTENIEFDQSTPVTLQTIGLIVKSNPVGVFAVLDLQHNLVRCYYYGKQANLSTLLDDGFSVDFANVEPVLAPYSIPDDPSTNNELDELMTERWHINDVLALGEQLELILRKMEYYFRHTGDNYRGEYWQKMVALIQMNSGTVEELLHQSLPKDKNDFEYNEIAERIAAEARKLRKRAHDELIATMLIVVFSPTEIEIGFASSIKEATEYLKKHGKKVKENSSLEKFIDEANENQGVYVVRHDDFEQKIIVAKVINEDDIELYISENVEDLNKQMNEHFKTLEEAVTSINSHDGRFALMTSALIG